MLTHVFVDESIHDRADFIVVAIVYTDDRIQVAVEEMLAASGYRPGVDEFKSSMAMAGNERAQALRDRMRHLLLSRCKLAVVVCSRGERARLGEFAIKLMREVAARDGDRPLTLHLDEGISTRTSDTQASWRVVAECDSRIVGGIQIADCAAFVVSMLLLAELGLNTKTIPPGDYPSDEPIELAWSLWTSLRYSLAGSEPVGAIDEQGYSPDMLPFGLLISDSCSDAVREAARLRLGSVWVGCIH